MHFIIHNAEGRILQWGECPPDMLSLQASAGRYVMQGEGRDTTHYVLRDSIVERPANPAMLNLQVLTQVPLPATITINGSRYDVNDSTVDLDFTYPGTYTVTVAAFPYLDKTFTVTV